MSIIGPRKYVTISGNQTHRSTSERFIQTPFDHFYINIQVELNNINANDNITEAQNKSIHYYLKDSAVGTLTEGTLLYAPLYGYNRGHTNYSIRFDRILDDPRIEYTVAFLRLYLDANGNNPNATGSFECYF